MKRRSFLAAIGLAPIAGALARMPAIEAAPAATASFSIRTQTDRAWIGLETRAAIDGTYRAGGFFIDVPSDEAPTRVALEADQFRIVDCA